MNTLPFDMVVLVAKFVYGEDKVVVRKGGYVSFRILKIDPCIFKIPTFSVDFYDDGKLSSKTVVFDDTVVTNTMIGWTDCNAPIKTADRRSKKYIMSMIPDRRAKLENAFRYSFGYIDVWYYKDGGSYQRDSHTIYSIKESEQMQIYTNPVKM